jgi:hypothetical protein
MFHLGQNFGLFRLVSAGICNPAEILFWLFIYIFFLSFDLTGPFSLFLLLLPFSSFFFLLLSSAQLSLCTFSLPFFFFLSFWFKCRDCREVLKAEMKKKKKTEEMDRLQWSIEGGDEEKKRQKK